MTLWLFFFLFLQNLLLSVFTALKKKKLAKYKLHNLFNLDFSFLILHFSPVLFHQVTHPPLCTNSASVCRKPCPPELWSVTMVFVSSPSNAIITLNSYSVKSTSAHSFTFGFKCFVFCFLNKSSCFKFVVHTVKQDCMSAVPMALCTLHQSRRWK